MRNDEVGQTVRAEIMREWCLFGVSKQKRKGTGEGAKRKRMGWMYSVTVELTVRIPHARLDGP